MTDATDITPVAHAVLVDDDAGEGDSIAALLQDDETLLCLPMRPATRVDETVKTLLQALPEQGPRVVLLDYRLEDHEMSDGTRAQFRGGTVAGYVRDVAPEVPIILLTSDDKLRTWVEARPGVEEVFDWTLLKNEIVMRRQTDALRARVVDIANTWAVLTRAAADQELSLWAELAEIMGADEELLEPFVRLDTSPPRPDTPGSVARWLLGRALRWDGPLVRDAQARVTLGIDTVSFETEAVAEWLHDTCYSGPLRAFGRRWWASRVRAKLAAAAADSRPVDASTRAAVVSAATGVEVQVELCRWCHGERTVRACAVCGSASDAAHAIRVLSDAPPAWAEAPVVCYHCILDGSAEGAGVRFPTEAEDVVGELKAGRMKPPDRP